MRFAEGYWFGVTIKQGGVAQGCTWSIYLFVTWILMQPNEERQWNTQEPAQEHNSKHCTTSDLVQQYQRPNRALKWLWLFRTELRKSTIVVSKNRISIAPRWSNRGTLLLNDVYSGTVQLRGRAWTVNKLDQFASRTWKWTMKSKLHTAEVITISDRCYAIGSKQHPIMRPQRGPLKLERLLCTNRIMQEMLIGVSWSKARRYYCNSLQVRHMQLYGLYPQAKSLFPLRR